MENLSEQEIIKALNAAPQVVQDAVVALNTIKVISGFQKQFGLHLDKLKKVAELNRNLLLGLIGPQEFLKELVAVGVPEADAQQIMAEINQKIFVPLREKMKNGGGNTQQPIKAAEPTKLVAPPVAWKASVPQPPRPPIVNASVPSYSYTPPTQTSQHFHLENKIPPRPAVAFSEGGLPPRPVQINQRPVNIGRLLEDHEEPHIEFTRTSMPARTAPPPPNLPGAMPPQAIPPGVRFSPTAPRFEPIPVLPKVEPPAPLPPSTFPLTPSSAPSSTPPELAKSYVDDPYREPIEEGSR